MAAALTTSEQADFDRLENVVREGLQTFRQVGEALVEIHDRKLYKAVCSTFEAYLQVRWQMSRRTARQHMEAAEVMGLLSAGGAMAPLPENERQVRPLTSLPPEQQPEAWKEAVETAKAEGRPVTAQHTRIAAEARKARPKHEKAEDAAAAIVASTQREEPAHVAPDGGPILPSDVAREARREYRESTIGKARRYVIGLGIVPEFSDEEVADIAVQLTPGDILSLDLHQKLIRRLLDRAGKEKIRVLR